jgi:hypothetical protein
MVEVALPYCLHVPNHLACRVVLPKQGTDALVTFCKYWTENAEGSGTADLFAHDRVTYFSGTTLQTPEFPEKPILGPEPRCKGKNVERDRETAGYFRYSRLRVFFDTRYEGLPQGPKGVFETVQTEVLAKARTIVNRVLDAYRLVTRDDFVQRIGALHVTDLYFAEHNIGVHGADFGHGIRTAIMNRSGREIEEFANILETGRELPVHELLFLDAGAALADSRFLLAVVHAFQALEIFLEGYLREAFARKGLAPGAIDDKLDHTRRTKERLRDLLPEATGRSLRENTALWDAFCTCYDTVRNRLIHAAAEIDSDKAGNALAICRQVVDWIAALQVGPSA